ncbi:MAG TPA: acyltransferase [Bradyrhizobium sp.]|nr:acyltransferase [Bradyrhizobium sp.]
MLALTPFPSRIKVFVYRRVLNFDVASDARIGLSIILCRNLVLASGASIGHMNVIRGNMTLRMDVRSVIGQFNWITAGNSDPRYFQGYDRHPELVLGEESSITSRHVLDCTDRIEIGRLTTIAGYRSSIITHGIDYRRATQSCGPIKLGDFCLIGSNAIILMGVTVANRSIVGAGAVLAKSIDQELGIWAGAPARRIRDLSGEEGYFTRQSGHIY